MIRKNQLSSAAPPAMPIPSIPCALRHDSDVLVDMRSEVDGVKGKYLGGRASKCLRDRSYGR